MARSPKLKLAKKGPKKVRRVKVKYDAAKAKRECLQKTMRFTMEQYKRGTLRTLTGYPPRDRAQALAVGYERANQTCGRIPKQPVVRTRAALRKKARELRGPLPRKPDPLLRRTIIVRKNGRLERQVVYVRRPK